MRKLGGRTALTALIATLAWGSAQAAAAPTIEREVPIDPSSPYTPAPDGSVWTTYATSGSGGTVLHLDGQNGSTIDSFVVAENGYLPRAIGYANNRVYIAQYGASSNQIISLLVNGPSGTTNPGLLQSDAETGYRLGSTNIFMRVSPDGTGNVALGQQGTVGALNLSDLTAAHPFYPQQFFGAGINDGNGGTFQACHIDGPGTGTQCAAGGGGGGPAPGQFDYPTDMAPDGAGGFYVTEYNGHTVTHVAPTIAGGMGGYALDNFGSGPGSGAGQLFSPDSIRRIPATGRVVISSPPIGRLDEFSPAGAYERSYGFGVLTGEDEFQTCGVGIGACQAGVPYQDDPRSYFTQLDIVDGKLWAATELDDSIQVIDLGGAGESLALKANPVKIKKGEKATLTATLENCDDGDSVSFQRKTGSAWEDLGSAVATNADCKAKKKLKIKKTSTFRAVALDSEGATIATSPKVKIQLR
jgi:hypothetical protein